MTVLWYSTACNELVHALDSKKDPRGPKISVKTAGTPRRPRITFTEVYKKCGNRGCQCHRPRGRRHGPYWYKREWDGKAQKMKLKYCGKSERMPAEAVAELQRERFFEKATD